MPAVKCNIDEFHTERAKPPHTTTYLNCPLLGGRQICLWCCLHISDIANPLTRVWAGEKNQEYLDILKLLPPERADWDLMWSTCYRCSAGR
jgi:hypothetical protein